MKVKVAKSEIAVVKDENNINVIFVKLLLAFSWHKYSKHKWNCWCI